MAIIELNNITFRRGKKTILDNLSWEIEKGQNWALLGANGSGKTTLLKIITGYSWPSSGSVTLLHKRFGQCDIRECRKAVGWVSSAIQEQLPARDTVLEIVASGIDASLGLYRNFSEQEIQKAHQAMQLVSAQHIANQSYATLSQGEKQRAVIARALVNSPQVLILDEPCIGLDPAARKLFLDDLADLAERPDAPTMIFVTHHIEEIAPWINHVLVLKQGRQLASGDKNGILIPQIMSEAFDTKCQINTDSQGGHHLTVI